MGGYAVTPGEVGRRQFLAVAGSAALAAAGAACSSPSTEGNPRSGERASFPDGFTFGLATSAYQVEGATTADGRGRSIWDTFATKPGTIDDGSSGAVACDHYHRWEADLDLLKGLSATSYRFSVAWPRVLPEGRGQPNAKGLDFYRRLVGGLRQRGIEPVATIYHWDLPQALQDAGGWGVRESADWFADYAAILFDALPDVGTWLTVNEPKIIVQQAYQLGWMAPGLQDTHLSGRVLHHLHLAHGRAVQAFRASGNAGRIGACPVVSPVYPFTETDESRAKAALSDITENTLYLDPILRGRYPRLDGQEPAMVAGLRSAERDGDLAVMSTPVDLLGLNYYSPVFVDDFEQPRMRYPVASNGWQQVYPRGLHDVLVRLHRDYGLPLMVCENGIPDAAGQSPLEDPHRVDFLRGHLLAVHDAIADGAQVLGYHAWSLMDNFEWARGYTQRWGVLHVDFETQQRTRKKSADWLADVMAHGSVPRS